MADLNVGGIKAELSLEAQAWKQGLKESLDSLNRWNNDVGRTLSKFNQQVSAQIADAGKAMAGIGLAVTAGLGGAMKAFSDFDKAAREVNSIMRLGEKEAQGYRNQVRELTRGLNLNVSAAEAMRGAYAVASSGFTQAADQAKVLTAGLRLAVAGGADTKDTLNALTGALQAYGKGAADAADFADVLAKTVELGQTEIADLVPTLSRATTTAASAGVSFEELGSAIATMTVKGAPTANTMDALNQAMIQMQAPGKDAQKVLARVGLEADTLAKTLRGKGLRAALVQVFEATGGRMDLLKPILGDVNAVKAAQMLGAGGGADLAASSKQMDSRAGTAENSSGEITKAFSEQLGITMNMVNDLAISIGEALAPSLASLNAILQQVVGFFQGLPEPVKAAAAQALALGAALAVVAGGALMLVPQLVALKGMLVGAGGLAVLLPGLKVALASAGAALGSLALPVAAVATATAALVVAWRNNWGDIQGRTQTAVAFLTGVFQQARGTLTRVWESTWQSIQNAWKVVVAELTPALNELRAFFGDVWPDIQRTVGLALAGLVPAVKLAMATIWESVKLYLGLSWEAFKVGWQAIKGATATAWIGIRAVLESALQVIRGLTETWAQLMQGNWRAALDRLVETVRGVTDNLVQAFREMLARGIQAIADTVGQFSKAGSAIVDAFAAGIRGNRSAAEQAAREMTSAVRSEMAGSPAMGGLAAWVDQTTTQGRGDGVQQRVSEQQAYWASRQARGSAAQAPAPAGPGYAPPPAGFGGTAAGSGGRTAKAPSPAEMMAYIRQHADTSAIALAQLQAEALKATYKLVQNAVASNVRLAFTSGARGPRYPGDTSFHTAGKAVDFHVPGLVDNDPRAQGMLEALAAGTGFKTGINEYNSAARKITGGSGPHGHLTTGVEPGAAAGLPGFFTVKGSGGVGGGMARLAADLEQFRQQLRELTQEMIQNPYQRERSEVNQKFGKMRQQAKDAGATEAELRQVDSLRLEAIERVNVAELRAAKDLQSQLLLQRLELGGQVQEAEVQRVRMQAAEERRSLQDLLTERRLGLTEYLEQVAAVNEGEAAQVQRLNEKRRQESTKMWQELYRTGEQAREAKAASEQADLQFDIDLGRQKRDAMIRFLNEQLEAEKLSEAKQREMALALMDLHKQEFAERLQAQADFNIMDVEQEVQRLTLRTDLTLAEEARLAAGRTVLHQEQIARKQEEQAMIQGLESSFQQFLVQTLSGQQSFALTFQNLWKSIANTVIAELAKMIAQTAAFQAVLKGLKMLMGGIFGGIFHGGGVVEGGMSGVPLPVAHTGGLVVPKGIQAFHAGGLVGERLKNDEVMAKLQTGEVVLSRRQVRALRGSRGGTTIINHISPSMVEQVDPDRLGRVVGREILWSTQGVS